jgi:hypothetical protein
MSNSGFINIKPALTFRPLSPFLALLIASATKRLEGPEELAPTSVVQPRTIAPAGEPDVPRLDRTV